MRKVLPYLGAALSTLVIAWSTPAVAQNQFKDLDPNHWAYSAVNELQQKGILLGYPDGYFRGKRTLTRYEFAVALDRLLKNLPPPGQGPKGDTGPAGADGAPGAQGEKGEKGDPGISPEELANLKRLAEEFRNELTSLGTDLKAVKSRLDALSNDVADIKRRLDRMPVITGGFFGGFRADQSRNAFADYGGATRQANHAGIFSNVDSLHDFQLGIKANLPKGATFTGSAVFSNYLNYDTPGAKPISAIPFAAAGGAGAGSTERISLYQAQLDIPLAGFGRDTLLTVGRHKMQLTPLTYWRPDTDPYFDLPWYDDGNYVQDGIKLQSKFGSATTQVWAGSFKSVDTNNGVLNQAVIGALAGPRTSAIGGVSSFKPLGFAAQGSSIVNQTAGLHAGIPLGRVGELGLTLADFSTPSTASVLGSYSNVVLYGANFKLNPIGRLTFSAEGAKTVYQSSFDTGSNVYNDDNNAYITTLGYDAGAVKVTAGYQYIDPRFGAPGYWNKIGSWYNPTNVRGPFGKLTWQVKDSLLLYGGGDIIEGARNRAITVGAVGNGGFGIADNLYRANAGVKWTINKTFTTSFDYEGVFWDLSPNSSFSGVRSKPVEQYLTFGAGVNLTSNTVLKLGYQIINLQDVGGGFGFTSADGGNSANASVLTTQVAVKF